MAVRAWLGVCSALVHADPVVMAFERIESAQRRWRSVGAPHLVSLVRAGATFKNGTSSKAPKGSPQHETPRSTGHDYFPLRTAFPSCIGLGQRGPWTLQEA